MHITPRLARMGIEDDEAVQILRDRYTAFKTSLQEAETQYIQEGLQFHCTIPSKEWPSSEARQLSEGFMVGDGGSSESQSSNTLTTKLRNLQAQLCKVKEVAESGQLQASEDTINAADVRLRAFKDELCGLDQVARELTALNGLQCISVDAKAEHEDRVHDISFRANKALWCWTMELPLVKSWLAEGRVVSEEQAFVKLVKLGDMEVQKKLLWMAG